MAEFVIGGCTYRSSVMNARTQFHVARRLAPILSGLSDALGGEGEAVKLPAIAEAIASMPDAECDYVLDACLKTVQRQEKGGAAWSNVMTPGGQIMFEDIDMAVMVQIAWKVVEANLSGFFHALPSSPQGAEAQSPA